MQQSMEILQMNSQELLEYAHKLSNENPVIEVEVPTEGFDKFDALNKKLQWLNSVDEQNKVYYNEHHDEGEDINATDYGFSTIEDESLGQSLLFQLNYLNLEKANFETARKLIQYIDDNGYLEFPLEHLQREINIPLNKLEKALATIQTLEPVGVGAINLKECLLIQVQRELKHSAKACNSYLCKHERLIIELITNFLDLLGKNQLEQISKSLKVNIEDIKGAYKYIKTLNPRPGREFYVKRQPVYLTPDLIVIKFSNYFEVLINKNMDPKISISPYYQSLINEHSSEDVQEYIAAKVKQANWLVRCIEQRNGTLINVTKKIIEFQKDFFENNLGSLVPLKQKTIADSLGIHESTVSRAIRDKHLQCQKGIFPLDYFFLSGVESSKDSNVSTQNVKKQICDLIKTENKNKPYSDQQIADILSSNGLSVARRTVAKYREEAGVPTASKRKEF